MFTPFNSESLWIGSDLKTLSHIRETLAAEKIEYKIKTMDHLGQSVGIGRGSLRGNMGSFGNSSQQMKQHEVFVYTKDLERARYLINKR